MVKGNRSFSHLFLAGWLLCAFSPADLWGQETYIEPGAEVQVFVWGLEEELSRIVRVRRDGKFFFPWAGEVEAAGKTHKEVEEELRSRLSVYFRNFGVTVVPVDPKPVVSVMGEVEKVGPVELVPGMTLLQALSAAGGLKPTAMQSVRIFKSDQTVQQVDLQALFQGDLSKNIKLEPGDVIFVPAVGQLPVVILGQVARPGPVSVRPGATISEVVLAAGGFVTITQVQVGALQQRATGIFEVSVVRQGKQVGQVFIDAQTFQMTSENPVEGADTSPQEVMVVQEGDTLLVREIRRAVVVLGAVKNPGAYEVASDAKLTTLIAEAGGFGDDPNMREVKVIRMVNGGPNVIPVDLIQVLQKGETERDIEVLHQDLIYVPSRTRRLSWDSILDKVGKAFIPSQVITAFRDIF